MKKRNLQTVVKSIGILYFISVLTITIVGVTVYPKIGVEPEYRVLSFLNNIQVYRIIGLLYILIVLTICVGLYKLNELARKLFIIRFSIFIAVLIMGRVIAIVLHGFLPIIRYNYWFLSVELFLASIAVAIIIFLNSKTVKTLFQPIVIDARRAFFFCIIALIFLVTDAMRLERMLLLTDGYIAYYKAHSYYDNKEYNKALDNFLLASKSGMKKKIKSANYMIGNCYYELEDYHAAIEHYNKASEHGDMSWDVYYGIGLSYSNLEDKGKALEYFYKSIDAKEDYPESWSALGKTYLEQEDYQKAIGPFRKAIELKSEKTLVNYYGLAYSYFKLGQMDKSTEACEEYIAKHPKSEEINRLLEMVHRSNNPN